MIESANARVCSVIVSYQPDLVVLRKLLAGITTQVDAVVLVDNASDGTWQSALSSVMRERGGVLLAQSKNRGLASAQNIGIDWARSNGYHHVLLLDQDSEPAQGMVAALSGALQTLSTEHRVAAVGPQFHDHREGRHAPFVRIDFPLNRKLWCEHDAQTIACDFLISSGVLIPMAVLDQVGLMDEGLFIDNVDLEWSFRARAAGYALFGVCAATMHHRLGDSRHVLPFGSGQFVVHGPVRLYYMMRNRLLLYRMRHTPRVWIAQDLPRVLVKLFLFGVVVGPRRRNLRCMLSGLRDGLLGRQGARPEELW